MRSLTASVNMIDIGNSSGSSSDEESFETGGWNVKDSANLYRVNGWGFPYFSISSKGNMCVRPSGKPGSEVDLKSVVERVVSESKGNLSPPVIIRFPEIVQSRLHELQSAFEDAILANGYEGRFQGVFPVKCNPDKELVEEIVASGKAFGFGLEAGSKPELLLAMSCLSDTDRASPYAFLICNGYKDVQYIQLALLARALGINCVLVVEQVGEVEVIVEVSKKMGIDPVIGVRSKLHTKHAGHWGETCGENGKFGVSCVETVEIARRLKRHDMLDCLQVLHFHVGSQIPCLSIVEESVSEAAHVFCELSRLGADMKVLDIGGGLGIDYDGSATASSDMSVGYTVAQYADAVVRTVEAACALKNLDRRPVICCESGRGLVSHHSVLVFDIYAATRMPVGNKPALGLKQQLMSACQEIELDLDYSTETELLVLTLARLSELISDESYEIAVEFARKLKNDSVRLFKLGVANLQLRANAERVYDLLLGAAAGGGSGSATYHMNMSMFKSIPDAWAIGQLFPIVPLQRLDEEPTVRAVLSDLTCDSDGRIAAYVSDNPSSLPVHRLDEDQTSPYYMGLFLAGAYQEALSSMHNLFGSMHVVHVVSCDVDGFKVVHEEPGHNISDVLRMVKHDPAAMFDSLRGRVISSLAHGRFRNEYNARVALQMLARTFSSYTYLRTTANVGLV